MVSAPADGSRKRYVSYYWDGSLSESSKGSGIYNGLFDMRDIDAQVVTDVLAKARKLVEGKVENNYVSHLRARTRRRRDQRLRHQRLQRDRLPDRDLRRQGRHEVPALLIVTHG